MDENKQYGPEKLASENRDLHRKIRILEQEARNASRSTGSRRSAGGGPRYDPFDAGWGEL